MPVAVIDVGSNSGRIVVLTADVPSDLRVLEESRASLRLVRDLDREKAIGSRGTERVLRALHDFRALAEGAGVGRVYAVATAALREAPNGEELLLRVREETGIDVRVIDGEEEGRLAFLGAIHGLPVDHGYLVDIGGGSLQIVHFRQRRAKRVWTLPLGALRLSDRFLAQDPPAPQQVGQLVAHVEASLREAGIPRLRRGETLVGTGGSIRNLAKIDRRRRRYPIARVHGYTLTLRRLLGVAELLLARGESGRRGIPGLNTDRTDSIVGGVVTARTLMQVIGATHMLISGQGMREGVVIDVHGGHLPTPAEVRRSAIEGLSQRLGSWSAARVARRKTLAMVLLRTAAHDAHGELSETLEHASTILDAGRSIDYYRRHEHAAWVVMATSPSGFSHRGIALVAATMLSADDEKTNLKGFTPLLLAKDRPLVMRLGAALAVADAVEGVWPEAASGQVSCEATGDGVMLTAPIVPHTARVEKARAHFERAFGQPFRIGRRP